LVRSSAIPWVGVDFDRLRRVEFIETNPAGLDFVTYQSESYHLDFQMRRFYPVERAAEFLLQIAD